MLNEEHKKICAQKVYGHPCYNPAAHFKFGRIHLPVAPRCNIKCRYCVRKHDCANENRPGVTSRIITPEEAIEKVRFAVQRDPRISVIGIAGPGDPLDNDKTFETFRLAQKEFPYLNRCLSTNGLLLPEKIDILEELGVKTLTITINAIDPFIGSQIYSFVQYNGELFQGEDAFEVLNHNQLKGLRMAVKRGIVVKVNSVCIPTINSDHLIEVAKTVEKLGAYIMNVIPLIPQGEFAHLEAPSPIEIKRIRDGCENILFQFRHCVQCRADAVGVPSEEDCGKLAYAV